MMMSRWAACALLVSVVSGILAAGFTVARLDWATGLATLTALAAAWTSVGFVLRDQRRDRRRLEEVAELSTRRADQASVLSHELRTPLAVIQGAGELLAEERAGPLTDKQAVFVHRIIDNAVRMHNFSEQLLTRARLEAGLVSIERSRVDLRVLFRGVVEELSEISDVTVILDAPGAPVSAFVDPQLTRQVITNLVNNAARSESAGGRVEVRIVPGDDEVMISVSDGGTGMTDAQRERLFSRFSSGRPLGNGTGIGLFISQQFVELQGGRIHVDTISGKGTTMMFTLPLFDANTSGRRG
ncbi:sensor histidine kinase [Pseudoclavibacter helvolus]|uniref:sensor histidine kinase n=1 Tax=Pseudoclavibacter helvolus TaxID=255205 RepID=UPI003C766346